MAGGRDERVADLFFDDDNIVGEPTEEGQVRKVGNDLRAFIGGAAQSLLGGGGGAVSSVFGRIGAVVGELGDYAASLVTNDSGVAGATVADALDTLASAGRTAIAIWAEENAALSNNAFEWSYGNGDTPGANSGIPVAFDCFIFALALDHTTAASATVAVTVNGVQAATVTTSAEFNTVLQLGAPVAVSAGDVLNFQTVTGPGSAGGNRVAAFLRTTSDIVGQDVDSVFGRTGAVVAQVSDYDASQVDFAPDGDITAVEVQAAIVEVRDDTDTKLATKVDASRNLTAGAGLIGGGDLSADRTFDVGANGDGSIVVNADDIQVGVLAADAQHGVRGGGTQHAAATDTVNGFMSAADKSKLDGIEPNAKDDQVAVEVPYTPGAGLLVATEVQGALDELDVRTQFIAAADNFSAYDSLGAQTFSGATITIDFDTERFASTGTYTLSSGEVTIGLDGNYDISYEASFEAAGGSRSSVETWLEVNGVEVPGTRAIYYIRQSGYGSSGAASLELPLVASDVVRVRAARTNGNATSSLLADGSRFNIFKV